MAPSPCPTAMPVIGARLGIDRKPVDVTDPIESRWLEACVWPDQADRFHRLRAAIELATTAQPRVRSGDAIAGLRTAVAEVGDPLPSRRDQLVGAQLSDADPSASPT